VTLRTWDRGRLALGLAGAAISAYLTVIHYRTGAVAACLDTGLVDCEAVLTSPQSSLAGLPLAVWGLAWFGMAAAFSLAALVFAGREPSWLTRVSMLWTIGGTVVALRLIYVELALLGALCLWCTAAHIIIGALLVAEVLSYPLRLDGKASPDGRGHG